MQDPLIDIAHERLRQIGGEGFALDFDVGRQAELAAAAGCYLLFADAYPNPGQPPEQWPWDAKWWKPKSWRRDWIRAGALTAAAIEAGDRQAGGRRIERRAPVGKDVRRLSYVAGRVNVQLRELEEYSPGESYVMPELEYHHTPNSGIVVTLMEKLTEGTIHACSVVERPHTFDQDFDRFQWTPAQLWQVVLEALAQ